MNIRIKAAPSDRSEALEAYIAKKVNRLERKLEGVDAVDVQLKIVNKQTTNNKAVVISLPFMGSSIRVEKTCGTYNEGVDKCIDVVKEQIEKIKDKVKDKA